MKMVFIAFASFMLVYLFSCDYSLHVAIRNYKAPCKVAVTYDKSHGILDDSDTLRTINLQHDTQYSWLVRENTSGTS